MADFVRCKVDCRPSGLETGIDPLLPKNKPSFDLAPEHEIYRTIRDVDQPRWIEAPQARARRRGNRPCRSPRFDGGYQRTVLVRRGAEIAQACVRLATGAAPQWFERCATFRCLAFPRARAAVALRSPARISRQACAGQVRKAEMSPGRRSASATDFAGCYWSVVELEWSLLYRR
jgi:hypothetical protein